MSYPYAILSKTMSGAAALSLRDEIDSILRDEKESLNVPDIAHEKLNLAQRYMALAVELIDGRRYIRCEDKLLVSELFKAVRRDINEHIGQGAIAFAMDED